MWKKKLSESFNQTAANVFLCSTVSYCVIISLFFFFPPTGSPFEICRSCPEQNNTSRCGFTKEVGQECVKDPRGSDLSPTSSLSPYLFLCRGAVKTKASGRLVKPPARWHWNDDSMCRYIQLWKQLSIRTGARGRSVVFFQKTRRTDFGKLQKIYLYVLAIFARVPSE